MKAEYRQLANPKLFNAALDKAGVLANRAELAEQADYDWHARKLHFEQHFRGHILMHMTPYTSTRDHQWAAQHDPLFIACGAGLDKYSSKINLVFFADPIQNIFQRLL